MNPRVHIPGDASSAADPQWGDATHPPVLFVFNQVGPRPALKQMEKVADLTREHWQGQWAEGCFRIYNGKMPIVATTLELLREHGSAGPAFRRFGCEDYQNLWDAIGNPRRDAARARRAEDARRRQAQEAAEREAQRPVCADCGTKFTDDRWKAAPRSTGAAGTATRTCAKTARRGHSERSGRPNKPNASARSRSAKRRKRRRTEPGRSGVS
ncbi:hypothetical protein OG568_51720 (plasmid) [Streptomyces sp. NBC_01450]|uniref:hypothetical protein n=1 Tax=Streptomyces sp. NBC_01450 TaxID=2903871 RepID=UPI002E3673F4|nr:hypothetical protein [Streptomyces sp. NBC_01450]